MSSLEQLGFSFQPQRRIFTVRDLVATVRTALEREYTDVWIGGEISNYRPADSGHLYFTLKDGEAQLRVVMFRTQARLLRFRPDNGMEIVARGRVTIYESRGELLRLELVRDPSGLVAAPHLHPYQEERFEVLEGTVRFRIAGVEHDAHPGEVVTVDTATPHVLGNPTDQRWQL